MPRHARLNPNLKDGTGTDPLPAWKRVFDLTGASLGLIALAPLMIVIASYIWLVSGRPILFKHRRHGYQGLPLHVWKFRSMHVSADPSSHQNHVLKMVEDQDSQLKKLNTDSELIPLGKWMRCTAIDELPQLFNVLKGEMSLVGPRPDVVPLEQYSIRQQKRFDVLPGLTGLWQISGKNHTTFREMNQLDERYVDQRSLLLDTKIVILTLPVILKEVCEDFLSKSPQPESHSHLPMERQHDSTT